MDEIEECASRLAHNLAPKNLLWNPFDQLLNSLSGSLENLSASATNLVRKRRSWAATVKNDQSIFTILAEYRVETGSLSAGSEPKSSSNDSLEESIQQFEQPQLPASLDSISFTNEIDSPSSDEGFFDQSISDEFARKLGYACFEEIQLYCELLILIDQRRFGKVSRKSAQSLCTRSVARFGLGYEDSCKFPLVLSVFSDECLTRKTVTWDLIRLMADATLAVWQRSALLNLRKHLNSVSIFGAPSGWICVEPNRYLRELCSQLPSNGSQQPLPEVSTTTVISSIRRADKHRCLKRWNSFEDLQTEAIGWRQSRQTTQVVDCQTDDRLTTKVSKFCPQPRAVFAGSNRTFNELMSSISFEYCSNETRIVDDLCQILQSTSVHFALYMTKVQLEIFRSFDQNLLCSLVFSKNFANGITFSSPLKSLLMFDEALVTLARELFAKSKDKAKTLMFLIETTVILRQMHNYYGLDILIKSIQSPVAYFATQAWRDLSTRSNKHLRDFRKLSQLCGQLNDQCLIGVSQPFIPTLPALINRHRISCTILWDLFESDPRRFTQHPFFSSFPLDPLFEECLRTTRIVDHKMLHVDVSKKSFLDHLEPVRVFHIHDHPTARHRSILTIPDAILTKLLPHLKLVIEESAYRDYILPDKFY